MEKVKKVRIAVAGFGCYGRTFAKLFQIHPDVEYVGICETNSELIAQAQAAGFRRIHGDYRDVLSGDEYDAVHIALPVENHVKPTLDVLAAGKHCACAVPMAFTLEEIRSIVAAERAARKNYMMMETVVYSPEYLFVKDLFARGDMGRLQFMHGWHYQDMEDWPGGWKGMPPMWYATHAVSPLLDLPKSRATRVIGFGSGMMRDELRSFHGNPFPAETMTFQIEKSNVVAEVSRTLFETAVVYSESFELYGSKASFFSRTGELVRLLKHEDGNRGTPIDVSKPEIGDLYALEKLPADFRDAIIKIKGRPVYAGPANEFIRSIVEKRKPAIGAVTAANWCAVGICAHESALAGGKIVDVPRFD